MHGVNPNLKKKRECNSLIQIRENTDQKYTVFGKFSRSFIYYKSFFKALLNFIRPGEKKIYNIHDQVGMKLLARLG